MEEAMRLLAPRVQTGDSGAAVARLRQPRSV